MNYEFRTLEPRDAEALLELYVATARASAGMGRDADEYSLDRICETVERVGPSATSIGASDADRLCGEIHGRRLEARRFRHVVTDVSVAVHPDHQGRGLGRRLFEKLFDWTRDLRPAIERIELILLATNGGALHLYESLGFQVEGRMIGRVRFPDGRTEDDIMMARLRPRYPGEPVVTTKAEETSR